MRCSQVFQVASKLKHFNFIIKYIGIRTIGAWRTKISKISCIPNASRTQSGDRCLASYPSLASPSLSSSSIIILFIFSISPIPLSVNSTSWSSPLPPLSSLPSAAVHPPSRLLHLQHHLRRCVPLLPKLTPLPKARRSLPRPRLWVGRTNVKMFGARLICWIIKVGLHS